MTSRKQGNTRRKFLKTISAAATTIPLVSRGQQKPSDVSKISGRKPRNVILILSDDHRYDFMSFMNGPQFLETPNLDRMAQKGAHFENSFVVTSLCSPSRATILTGQYTHKHGIVDNNTLVPLDKIFFPQYLQQIGYETAFMGKWHIGKSSDAPRRGFDKWISFKGQGYYYDPVFNIDGKLIERSGYFTDILTDYAIEWLTTERDKNNPFFLFISHKAVHLGFEPAKRHLGKYENVKLSYPESMKNTEENYKEKPGWVKEQRNSWHGVDYLYYNHRDFDTIYKRYCETLLGIDESIGRILDLLEDTGLAESTLVLYTSDNGFSLGEHGLIDKRHMYEESFRVPLLAYCPELIKPHSKIPKLVQNIDIAPTILHAAGIQKPSQMDGLSFLPLLEGEDVRWRDAVFYEYYWERNLPQTPTIHGVRTDRYKYIHYYGLWDIDELYDLQNDPDEMNNLINSEKHQELIKEMNTRMYDWLEKSNGLLIPLKRDRGGRRTERKPL